MGDGTNIPLRTAATLQAAFFIYPNSLQPLILSFSLWEKGR